MITDIRLRSTTEIRPESCRPAGRQVLHQNAATSNPGGATSNDNQGVNFR